MALNFLNNGYFAGKVGIGETNPTEKLEINGQFGKTTLNGHVVAYTRASANYLYASAVGGDLRFTVNGNTVGLPAMMISTTGNVGIGETSPTSKLSIKGSDAAIDITRGNAGDSKWEFSSDSTAMYIAEMSTGTRDYIMTLKETTGNVGIGTTNPTKKLHVTTTTSNSTPQMLVQNSGTGDASVLLNVSGQSYVFGIDYDDSKKFKIASSGNLGTTDRITLLSTGNVGIGTITPTEKLDISGTAIVRSTLFTVGNVHGFNPSFGASFFINNNGGTSYFNATGGNVGIGTTTPNGKLTISDANATGLEINPLDSQNRVNIMAYDRVDSAYRELNFDGSNYNFEISNSTKMVINSSGNIGIGTTSPSAKLEVNGEVKFLAGGSFASGVVFGGTLSLQSNIEILNKAQTAYIPFATRNLTGSEVVMDLTNVGSINGGAAGPYLPLTGGTMTGTNGVLMPDNFRLKFGDATTPDLEIFHNATDSFIINEVGNLKITQGANDKDIIFESDNGSGGTTEYFRIDGGDEINYFFKDIKFLDNGKIKFGDASDLQIYHSSSNNISFITNSNAAGLRLQSDELIIFANNGTTARADFDIAVKLFYNDSKKFETTNTGVTVTGTAKATAIEIESAVPSILFDETDVTANWRNRVQSGGYRIQYASDGTTFVDHLTLGANANTVLKDTTFVGNVTLDNILLTPSTLPAVNTPSINLRSSNNEVYFQAGSANVFNFMKADYTTMLSLDGTSNATFAGTVTAGSYFLGDDTSISLATTGAGTVFLRPNGQSSTAQSSFTTTLATIGTSIAITGAATATTATTSTDNNATLTTKGYVDGLVTGVPVYKGTWDARNIAEGGATDGGNPDLRLAANKVLGNYYIVSTAGSASPNGGTTEPNSWNVGDWCIFSDITPGAGTDLWQKIDNTSVISGAGTGQKVTKWEGTSGAASETLTDGPITFSGNNSTFAGTISSGNITSTGTISGLVVISRDNMFVDAGQLYIGAAASNVDNSFRQAVSSGTFKLQKRISGTFTNVLDFDSSSNATFAGTVETTTLRTDVVNNKANSANIIYRSGTNTIVGNNASAVVIQDGGNVGIGTVSPNAKLDVNGVVVISPNTDGKETFRFTTGSLDDARLFMKSDTTVKVDIQANGLSYFNGGNVGIGTTSPGAKLEISHGGANNGLLLENTLNSSNHQIALNIRENEGLIFQRWISGVFNGNLMRIGYTGAIKFDAYDGTNNTGTPTYILGTDSSGNVVKVLGADIPGVPGGSGTVNQIPLWTPNGDTLGNSILSQVGTSVKQGVAGTSGSGYYFFNTTTTGDSGLIFADNTSTNSGFLTYNHNNDTMKFGTSTVERMRIDSAGNVGIGLTNPLNKLTVQASNTGTQVTTIPVGKFINTGNAFSKLILGSNNSNFDGVVSMDNDSTLANTKLRIYIGNGTTATTGHSNDHIVLQGNGNVGIGTNDPDEKLVLYKNINYNSDSALFSAYAVNSTAVNNNEVFKWRTGITGNQSGHSLTFSTLARTQSSYVERMRISSAGNVGIGTTSPNGKLSFESAVETRKIVLYDGGINNDFQFYGFGIEANKLIYTTGSNTDDHVFFSGANATTRNELMRIEGGGNVGIGTTSTNAKLTVLSSNNTLPTLQIQSAGGYGLLAGFSDPYHGMIFRGIPNSALTYGVTAGDQMSFYEYGGDFRFFEKNSIGASGNLNEISRIHKTNSFFLSNVGIGTASPNTYSSQTTLTINGSTYGRLDLESAGTLRSSLFSQAANTSLAVSTGFFSLDTGGSERMRISAAGDVGIGKTTSLQSHKLSILKGASNQQLGLYYDETHLTAIGTKSNGDLQIYAWNGSSYRNILLGVDGGAAGGNVGIGTITPSAKLEVKIPTTNGILQRWYTTSGIAGQFEVDGGASVLALYQPGGNAFVVLNANGNSYLNGGNVGIGTTSPGRPLTINSDNADRAIRILENDSANESWDIGVDVDGDLNFFNSADTSPSVTFLDGGNVGIGVIDPEKKLEVKSDTTYDGIMLDVLSAPEITFRDRGNSDTRIGTGRHALDGFHIDTYSGNALLIKGSNRFVGIGTTSPDSKLDVRGTASGEIARFTTFNGSDSYIYIGRDDSTSEGLTLGYNSSNGDSTIKSVNGSHPIIFEQGTSERMRITSAGKVGIGTGSSGMASNQSCKLEVIGTSGQVRTTLSSTTARELVIQNDGYAGMTILGGTNHAAGIHFGAAAASNVGMINYFTGSNSMQFTTNGNANMTITNNNGTGNVGIGTTNPGVKLDVVGSIRTSGSISLSNAGVNTIQASNANNGYLRFLVDQQATALTLNADKTSTFGGVIYAVDGNKGAPGISFANDTDTGIFRDSSDTLVIGTGGSARIIIQSNGEVGINQTNPSATLHLKALTTNGVPFKLEGNANTTVEQMLIFTSKAYNSSSSWFNLVCQAGDGSGGALNTLIIERDGDLRNKNNSYGQISDSRLKENITDATPKLDDIMKVKVKNFNFIGEDLKQIGVVAQELEEVFPGLVKEDKQPDVNGEEGGIYKSVKYSVLVPILLKAMQEQQEIIEDLKTRITKLEN